MYDLNTITSKKRHWIARTSNIPQRFWGRDFEDVKKYMGYNSKEISGWLDNLLDGLILKNPGALGITGVGLLLDGEPGRGKTTNAVTALMEFVRRLPADDDAARKLLHMEAADYGMKSRVVYYLTMTDLLNKKKAMFDVEDETRAELQREMDGFHGRSTEDWRNVRLLVLDDLGKEYGSDYDKSSFDDILRSRYDKGLPTIITTNKPLESWNSAYSPAMGSFAHEAFIRVKLDGEDLRKKK
jgi:DNA replication protein DnaC